MILLTKVTPVNLNKQKGYGESNLVTEDNVYIVSFNFPQLNHEVVTIM